jgi:hypothetical protein
MRHDATQLSPLLAAPATCSWYTPAQPALGSHSLPACSHRQAARGRRRLPQQPAAQLPLPCCCYISGRAQLVFHPHSRQGRSRGARSTDTRRSLLLSISVPPSLNFWSCKSRCCLSDGAGCMHQSHPHTDGVQVQQRFGDEPAVASAAHSINRHGHGVPHPGTPKQCGVGACPPCAALRGSASRAWRCSRGTAHPPGCTPLMSGAPAAASMHQLCVCCCCCCCQQPQGGAEPEEGV